LKSFEHSPSESFLVRQYSRLTSAKINKIL